MADSEGPEVVWAGPAINDELLQCLQIVARAHGESTTADALMAGLPAEQARLTPSLFSRAALRAHLTSQLVKTPLGELKSALLPAIVLLKGGRACVLFGYNADRSEATVVLPELSDSHVQLPLADLEADYLGTSIYARPSHRYDARSPEVRASRDGHWFWSVIAESRPLYSDVLLAAFMANLFALGMPLFLRIVYDRVVPNHAFDTLWVLTSGLMVMLIGGLILRIVRGRFVDLASSRADVKLSAVIMEHVLGTRMEHRPASAGSFASNLRAFESVRDFVGSATVVAFIDLPFAVVFVAVIAWIEWVMVIPLLIGATVMLLYGLAVKRRMTELTAETYRAGAQRNASLIEALVGFETIKALAAEGRIQRKWERSAVLLARLGTQLKLLSSTASNSSSFIQQFINLIIVIIGVYLIADKQLTMGAMIACTMLAARAMSPIGQVSGLLVQYHTAATALTTLDEMMQKAVERPVGTNFISRGRLKGAIEFRAVEFSYPGQAAPSLREVNFTIKPGEKVAILGRIGSGKTTLEKLILGLYVPSQGAVLVDGVDVRQLDPAELRRQIGYVQQDVMLFYGSLRENITLGAPLADDADIIKAAEVGGILGLVNHHPQGFDMLVGERGESLSGGQRQGVAIARAAINNPPIMLLDEPTSSMDFSSEDDIKQRLGAFCLDKTMLLVSHRTSLLDLVDRIIVLDAGRIVADGPKEQVVTALRQGRIGKGA